jgi:hypothetical protein
MDGHADHLASGLNFPFKLSQGSDPQYVFNNITGPHIKIFIEFDQHFLKFLGRENLFPEGGLKIRGWVPGVFFPNILFKDPGF